MALCSEDGYNHLIFPCGASLCFICGNAAFDRLGGFNHWGQGGCPKYHTVGSGQERFDNGQYDNQEPHLVPLGRVYGTFLYVNGLDEHFGEVYKDNSKLCWQTCSHRHDLFDRHGWKYPLLELRRAGACHMFNRAMQATATLPHKSVTLRRLLDNNSGPITTSQRRRILELFSPKRINARRWKTESIPAMTFEWFNDELVDDLIALRPHISEDLDHHYPFALVKRSHHIGLLYAPIGGVFFMAFSEQRMNAFQWLNRAVSNFRSEDDPNNLALFSFLWPDNGQTQLLISSSQQRVLVLPYHRVTFEVFTTNVLLAWVRRRSDPEPKNLRKPMPAEILDRWRSALMTVEQRDLQLLGLLPLEGRRCS